MISDLRTSIVSAMLDICLLCCAMTVFRALISRSSASVLELPSPIAGVVGVANPDADDACFEVGIAKSSGYSIVSNVITSIYALYLPCPIRLVRGLSQSPSVLPRVRLLVRWLHPSLQLKKLA